ncbi:uncharacterized protein [Nicotiana sylvestris]|uniref:uncharacterized protein n=1 Tax=Nicotiana sylvestris TaxID=4096 RepID=UPI00388C9490
MHDLGSQVSVAYKDLCPFPDVQLSAGFKMPKFDLYEGHGDPVAHLRGFCSKMRGAGGKDELLIAYFGQSLSGSALEWYTRQDPARWYTWDDLAQAFIGHFQYNLEIVPDRLSLLKLEKKPGESFRKFGFRWREQAARVDPPMRESEMVDYFLQTLKPTYFGHLVTAFGKSFNEVVKMGAMVEEGLKSNKIMSYSAINATTQAIQSGTGGVLGKKKKEEVATVEASTWSRSSNPPPYYNQPRPHHPNYPYTPYDPPQHYYPPPEPPFSVHHAQTYTHPPAHPQWRAQGAEPKKPSQTVMMIRSTEAKEKEKAVRAKPATQPKGVDDKPVVVIGKGSSVVAKKPEPAKSVVPGASSAPVVVVKRTYIEPVVIKPVVQLPVVDSIAVPWKYEKVVVTYKGKEIEEESCEAQGLMQSGRCFAPEELRKARATKNNPVLVKKAVTEEEAEEFLKKMKVQDYSIVEQLRKTPAQILLLSLLIHSDEHRRALMKILNEAHVPEKISVNHLETIASKIFEANRVTFSDDELPVEGTEHNKAFYLTVKCEDSVVTRVLIDNGSNANIYPLSTLNKLKVDDDRIHKNSICV